MIEKLQDLIARYLADRIDRSDFSRELAGLYFQARNNRNAPPEVRSLCNALIGPFGELSGGYRSEASFREVLARIASPFLGLAASEAILSVVAEPQDLEINFGITRKPPQAAVGFGPVEDLQVAFHA